MSANVVGPRLTARRGSAGNAPRIAAVAVLAVDPAKPSSIGNLDAIGSDAMNSPIITSLRQQYLELARREAELSARVGRDQHDPERPREREGF